MLSENNAIISHVLSRNGVNVHKFMNNDIRLVEVRDAHVKELGSNTFDLLTADGAVNNDINPDNTELDTVSLIISEIILATRLQKQEGCFVLTVIGLQYSITCECVALLSDMYNCVQSIKHFTSSACDEAK